MEKTDFLFVTGFAIANRHLDKALLIHLKAKWPRNEQNEDIARVFGLLAAQMRFMPFFVVHLHCQK